ncbi:hypothetical protein S83_027701, partial [Arachis hypogaea]
ILRKNQWVLKRHVQHEVLREVVQPKYIIYLKGGEETGSMRRCVHCKISYHTAIRFACLYFQTLSHICFSLSRKCNQRNREMKQRGRKHGKYMGLV